MKSPRRAYYVYVVELQSHDGSNMPSVYVGSSSERPSARFEKHLRGIRSSRHVRRFGVRLMPELYADLPIFLARSDARRAEQTLAKRLARLGYRVFGSCSKETAECVM